MEKELDWFFNTATIYHWFSNKPLFGSIQCWTYTVSVLSAAITSLLTSDVDQWELLFPEVSMWVANTHEANYIKNEMVWPVGGQQSLGRFKTCHFGLFRSVRTKSAVDSGLGQTAVLWSKKPLQKWISLATLTAVTTKVCLFVCNRNLWNGAVFRQCSISLIGMSIQLHGQFNIYLHFMFV